MCCIFFSLAALLCTPELFRGKQQYPVCPPVRSQFHFKILICQVQRYFILGQNIFKYTAFNFYPRRAPPFQKINEEKNQTARPPNNNYRPLNFPISLLDVLAGRVISRPDDGFSKDPRQAENNSTRLPCCFFRPRLLLSFFSFLSGYIQRVFRH